MFGEHVSSNEIQTKINVNSMLNTHLLICNFAFLFKIEYGTFYTNNKTVYYTKLTFTKFTILRGVGYMKKKYTIRYDSTIILGIILHTDLLVFHLNSSHIYITKAVHITKKQNKKKLLALLRKIFCGLIHGLESMKYEKMYKTYFEAAKKKLYTI